MYLCEVCGIEKRTARPKCKSCAGRESTLKMWANDNGTRRAAHSKLCKEKPPALGRKGGGRPWTEEYRKRYMASPAVQARIVNDRDRFIAMAYRMPKGGKHKPETIEKMQVSQQRRIANGYKPPAWSSMKGKFKCKNPAKYIGDSQNIIYRSGYELKAFMSLDNDPTVLKWASEEIAIPYVSPVDNRVHRYFVDLFVENNEGKLLIEIKPATQVRPPEKPKNQTRKAQNRYLKESVTHAINVAKWKSAAEWAKKHGCKFTILTERELKISNWGKYA